jgi:hypothetical protein
MVGQEVVLVARSRGLVRLEGFGDHAELVAGSGVSMFDPDVRSRATRLLPDPARLPPGPVIARRCRSPQARSQNQFAAVTTNLGAQPDIVAMAPTPTTKQKRRSK